VVIFEAEPVLGGIPRVLVPDFKLPKDIVDRQVGQILSMGITARTNVRVGSDIAFETIQENFDACLISVGTARDRKLDIAGAEHAQPALMFLRQVNLGQPVDVGDRVVILGGGGVAFDCAFTARRLGASEVQIICVEGEDCMCVDAEEIQQAAAENIKILNAKLAHEIQHDDGKATRVGYFEIAGFSFDECCRLSVERRNKKIEYLPADKIISAIGVLNDFSFLTPAASFSFTPQGTLAVDADTLSTSVKGVFAAGDAVLGPSSVAEAIGSGRRSAFSIHNYLCNRTNNSKVVIEDGGRVMERMQDGPSEPHIVEYEEIFNIWHHAKMKRQKTAPASVGKHIGLREEMVQGLGAAEARIEAGRCLHCGHCTACGICVEDCPGLILAMGEDGPEVAYPHECWHCGCCRIACPSGAIQYEFPLHMLV
jgi:NADPH-dependent glutamate synthase beta subunit-like oxidoreductase